MGRGRRKRVSKSRCICYRFDGPFDESDVEDVLRRARRDDIVFEFDTGRGDVVWFEGCPGADLRRVRELVKSLIKNCEEPEIWKTISQLRSKS